MNGFREKHSLQHVVLDVTFLAFDALQNKHHTSLLFMDLRSSFKKYIRRGFWWYKTWV